jgi:hypothetical protein
MAVRVNNTILLKKLQECAGECQYQFCGHEATLSEDLLASTTGNSAVSSTTTKRFY